MTKCCGAVSRDARWALRHVRAVHKFMGGLSRHVGDYADPDALAHDEASAWLHP